MAKQTQRIKSFQEFIEVLKKDGFQVLIPKEARDYCVFSKDNKIGYCQISFSGLLEFSTIHKPNRYTGTGYRIHSAITEPTTAHAKDAFVFAPNWANSKDVETIVKYKSLADYKDGLFGDQYKVA